MINANTKTNILTLIFFSLITVIITWPLIFHLNSLIIDPYDSLLINWIINWSINNPLDLNANIFYPYLKTLAYSDFHLVSVLTSAPFVLIFKEPLLAFNINFLLGFILTAFSAYLLVKLLTRDPRIALLTGVLFTFGQIHLGYMPHLQLFAFWPFILTLYFYFQKSYKLFSLFFFISFATMPLFFFFFLAFFAIHRKSLKPVLIAFLISTVVFIPYYLVSRQFNYVRPLTDAIHFSLTFQQFFREAGLVTLILIGVVIVKTKKMNEWVLLSIVAFVLALGPALHIFENTIHIGPLPAIPLPYLIFYYLLPGFSGFRTPSRWVLLAFFAFTVLFALTFKRKLSSKITALLILIIILQINLPFKYYEIPTRREFPPEQIWLSQNYNNAPIIQFPIYGWFDGQKIGVETLRMHYSTIHYLPMYNGFSGFSPKSWERDVQWLQKEFPSPETISYLRSIGIELIITPEMLKFKDLKLVKTFPSTNIYALDSNNN